MEISTAYENALLAQMAYANKLNDSKSGASLEMALMHSEFGAKDVTQAQAEYFASKYVVIQQTNNEETGFSATLFQEINEDGILGEYHLATRGTSSLNLTDPDWIDANLDNFNYGISYDQVTDLLNFYLRLTHASTESVAQFAFNEEVKFLGDPPPFQPSIILEEVMLAHGVTKTTYAVFNEIESTMGLGAIANTQELNLTGHSLGGHLASAFTLLFPSIVSSTTTFNSAGFIGDRFDEFANVIAQMANLSPEPVINSSVNITNIRAPLDPVSSLGSHLGGGLVDVFIEAEDGTIDSESHEMDRLVDSLAVMNLLNTLDSSFTLAKASQLLPMASSDEYTELEGVMNHLAKLFGQDEVAITNSDHDEVYRTINQITDSLAGKTYQISTIKLNGVR